jgi:type IV pilus assembly protein PilC
MAAKKEQKIFAWEGRNPEGKKVKGELVAANIPLAKAELRNQKIRVIRVKPKAEPFLQFKPRIKNADVNIFVRQLSTMLNAGIPLVQSLDVIISGIENSEFVKIVQQIRNDVSGGTTLAAAVRKFPEQFDEMFCNLINVGEESGTLDTLLVRIADYRERVELIKGKVKKAMIYPAIVLTVAFFISLFLIIFVVPKFETLYRGFGKELPLMTQMLINTSKFIGEWWYLILGIIAGTVFFLIRHYKNSPDFRRSISRIILSTPVFGMLLRKSIISRFSRTLATMFNAGVPLVEAMEPVASAAGNDIYRDIILLMRDNVAAGQQMHETLRRNDLFPTMVTQMIAIGEQSGTLDTMLSKVADFYEEQVNDAVDTLSTLLEPMIIIILGVVVGGIVVALYLPVLSMSTLLN